MGVQIVLDQAVNPTESASLKKITDVWFKVKKQGTGEGIARLQFRYFNLDMTVKVVNGRIVSIPAETANVYERISDNEVLFTDGTAHIIYLMQEDGEIVLSPTHQTESLGRFISKISYVPFSYQIEGTRPNAPLLFLDADVQPSSMWHMVLGLYMDYTADMSCWESSYPNMTAFVAEKGDNSYHQTFIGDFGDIHKSLRYLIIKGFPMSYKKRKNFTGYTLADIVCTKSALTLEETDNLSIDLAQANFVSGSEISVQGSVSQASQSARGVIMSKNVTINILS